MIGQPTLLKSKREEVAGESAIPFIPVCEPNIVYIAIIVDCESTCSKYQPAQG